MLPTVKPQKLILTLALAVLGAGYFGTFSGLEMSAGLKPMAMLLPVQLGVVIYFLWLKPKKDSVKY